VANGRCAWLDCHTACKYNSVFVRVLTKLMRWTHCHSQTSFIPGVSKFPQGSRLRGRLKNRWGNCVPTDITKCKAKNCRSKWPRGLRCGSAATRLLRLWVWIPPVAWMFVCYDCRVLSGRGLCNELITRPEESYWLWCFVVCDLETLWMRRPWSTAKKWDRKVKNQTWVGEVH
jgi:hypothetical protein